MSGKIIPLLQALMILGLSAQISKAQIPDRILSIFPEGTVMHQNIPYAGDTLKKHLLDIYLPADDTGGKRPLIVWIHGGAWNHNDKYADMGYMTKTVGGFIKSGYALASIDYRLSTDSMFPAQIQDCYQALMFLSEHADDYSIDPRKIVLAGFSAGGHLAALLGLTASDIPGEFITSDSPITFNISGVLDFYGPTDLLGLHGSDDPDSPESILIGAVPSDNPALARVASPISYVTPGDPPFLIVHGEYDESVPPQQSRQLSEKLTENGIANELIIVPGAPHYGEMFDQDAVRERVIAFLNEVLN